MRASELADPIVTWVNCPFVMCMGASPECSALILQSVRKGYNVLALGLDTPSCLRDRCGNQPRPAGRSPR